MSQDLLKYALQKSFNKWRRDGPEHVHRVHCLVWSIHAPECMENVAYIFVVERPVSYQLALNWHTSLAIAKQSSPLHLTTLWIQNFTAYVSSVHTLSAIKPTPFLLPMYTFFHWSGSAIKQDFKERHDAPIYLIPDANITPSGHIFHMSYILTIYHRLRCSRHACPWHWKH